MSLFGKGKKTWFHKQSVQKCYWILVEGRYNASLKHAVCRPFYVSDLSLIFSIQTVKCLKPDKTCRNLHID